MKHFKGFNRLLYTGKSIYLINITNLKIQSDIIELYYIWRWADGFEN